MCKIVLNSQLNGVELYFGEGNKPAREVLTDLKGNGFRWNGKKFCWYAKQNNDTLAAVNKYSNEVSTIETVPSASKKKNTTIDLWELTRVENFNNDSSLHTKEIAKEIRTHLKNRFPFVKFSIKTRSNSIDCNIINTPFEENSIYLEAIRNYCKEYANSYNWDNSDAMTDYYHVNFYGGHFDTSYNYEVVEATEEIKEAIKQFDIKKAEADKEEKAKQEREYKAYLLQCAASEKAYKERITQENQDKETIINSVEVVEIEEKDQYYVINADFANLNKNNTLEEYKKEVEAEDYYKSDLKVTREIHFKNIKSLKLFENMLLSDFDFIEGTGGSYTDDLRINSMTDYEHMTQEERKGVKWCLKGIAVYLENELMFVIDSQGYNYSRYVGLIAADTKTTKEYNCKQVITIEEAEELKEESKIVSNEFNSVVENNSLNDWYNTRKILIKSIKDKNIKLNRKIVQQVQDENTKQYLYKALKENDTIIDQFNSYDFIEGQQITIIRESAIGGASVSHAVYKGHTVEENSVIMTINVKNKRGLFTTTFEDRDKFLIYNGHIEGIESLLYEKISGGSRTIYGSYDSKAIGTILSSLKDNNIIPIVNSYEPVI